MNGLIKALRKQGITVGGKRNQFALRHVKSLADKRREYQEYMEALEARANEAPGEGEKRCGCYCDCRRVVRQEVRACFNCRFQAHTWNAHPCPWCGEEIVGRETHKCEIRI